MNIRKSKLLRRKSWFGKLLRLPFKLIPQNAVISILRGPLKGYRWIKGSHNISVLIGTYEQSQSRRFQESAEKAKVFWDLGAHVGYYTLLYHAANAAGSAFAFEPVQKNADLFQKHMMLNGVDKVKLFRVAVSDQEGKLSFSGGKTSVAGRIEHGGAYQVDVVRLSDWVSRAELETPQLIKMDIEGEEIKVLKDLSTLLRQHKPVVYLSTHGPLVHSQCVSLLAELGYSLKPLDAKTVEACREVLAS